MPALQRGVAIRVNAGSGAGGRMEVRAGLISGGGPNSSLLDPRVVEDPDESKLADSRKSLAIGSMRRSLAQGQRQGALMASPLAKQSGRMKKQLDFFATINGFPSTASDQKPQSTAAASRAEARRMVRSNLGNSGTKSESSSVHVIGGSLPALVLQRNVKCAKGVMLHLLDRSYALDPIGALQ